MRPFMAHVLPAPLSHETVLRLVSAFWTPLCRLSRRQIAVRFVTISNHIPSSILLSSSMSYSYITLVVSATVITYAHRKIPCQKCTNNTILSPLSSSSSSQSINQYSFINGMSERRPWTLHNDTIYNAVQR